MFMNCDSIRTLSSLMSLWTIPLSWRQATPANSCRAIFLAVPSPSPFLSLSFFLWLAVFFLRQSASEQLSKIFMTKQMLSSVSMDSLNSMILGWSIFFMMLIYRSRFVCRYGVLILFFGQIFIAYFLPETVCTSFTTEQLPLPIIPSILQFLRCSKLLCSVFFSDFMRLSLLTNSSLSNLSEFSRVIEKQLGSTEIFGRIFLLRWEHSSIS